MYFIYEMRGDDRSQTTSIQNEGKAGKHYGRNKKKTAVSYTHLDVYKRQVQMSIRDSEGVYQ